MTGHAPAAPTLRSFLDLTAGHLPEPEYADLADAPVTVAVQPGGAWVHVPPLEPDGHDPLPVVAGEDDGVSFEWRRWPNLLAVLRAARGLGAWWVHFDVDGHDALPGLPMYGLSAEMVDAPDYCGDHCGECQEEQARAAAEAEAPDEHTCCLDCRERCEPADDPAMGPATASAGVPVWRAIPAAPVDGHCCRIITPDGRTLDGAIIGMDVPEGIQACGDCEAIPGDLDAAAAVAQLVGGKARFYQQNHDQPHLHYPPGDGVIDGLTIRTVGDLDDGHGEQLIHGYTNPWVEIDGERICWYTMSASTPAAGQ